jgi:leucyl-tRNA synthetase
MTKHLVLDISTLQGLFRAGALDFLKTAFASVSIPEAVNAATRHYYEQPGGAERAPDMSRYSWIQVVKVSDQELIAAGGEPAGTHRGSERYKWKKQDIDRREFEAVIVAKARNAILLTETAAAATCARELGLEVWSLARMLRALQQDGHFNDARERAKKIIDTNFNQGDLRRLAGEDYEFEAVEPKWQKRWAEAKQNRAGTRPNAEKKYVLEMFPYPSGNMHMGHVRNYLIGDVLARYYRMRGFDVLHPFGWDALGLPAENAAIKDQRHPAERTAENIKTFRADTVSLGLSYDWEREVNTSDPGYYKWNQWFFIKMLEKGIVYRRKSRVNWCPGCATVIANEQVKEDGTCERSGDVVEQREMPEWAFRITSYAEQLLNGLDQLTEWPDRITSMQRHWIGKSEGAEVDFQLDGRAEKIRVFTTRIDTIFGCTYMVVAPEHPIVEKIATPKQLAAIRDLVKELKTQDVAVRTDEKTEKKGVDTGAFAINPFTNEKIPVWVANFVVATYGTGAVMSVPAHDERDYQFAKKYGIGMKAVIAPAKDDVKWDLADGEAFTDDGVLVNSGAFTGKSSAEARQALTADAEKRGIGKKTVNFHLRDWGFSRQRYWGTPIPIIYCDKCDPKHEGIPVPLEQLPVKLPDIDVKVVLTGRGEPPLAKVPSFVNVTCPKCGGAAKREVETMDTFVDSTWYYARYLSPHDDKQPFDPKEAQRWLPVDIYVGGPEHAVMHLLYFRFWTRVMKELGLVPMDEPVKRLITQGIVNGPDGRKMSKRWGNVISPGSIISEYGADTARLFVMFAGPPENDIDWSNEQVKGQFRFINRVWAFAKAHAGKPNEKFQGEVSGDALAIRRIVHKCLKRITESMEKLSFNTAIAGTMEAINSLSEIKDSDAPNMAAAWNESIRVLASCLSPFAPHFADELAELYGAKESLALQPWPTFDPALVADDTIKYVVQVNGKLRGEVQMPVQAAEDEIKQAAQALEAVQSQLAGKSVKRVVFVPKRLVNFVVA